jgi:sulfate adenylyltransferase
MADVLSSSPTPHTHLTRNPGKSLPAPHGGKLCELLLQGEELDALMLEAIQYPSLMVTPRQECDLEMLLNGGFTPLTGFLVQEDYERFVCDLTVVACA